MVQEEYAWETAAVIWRPAHTRAVVGYLARGTALAMFAFTLFLSAGSSHGADSHDHASKAAKRWIEKRLRDEGAFDVAFHRDLSVERLEGASLPGVWKASATASVIYSVDRTEERAVEIKLGEQCTDAADAFCWYGGPIWLDGEKLVPEGFRDEIFEIAHGGVSILSTFSTSALANEFGARFTSSPEHTQYAIKEATRLIKLRLEEFGYSDIVLVGDVLVELVGPDADDVWQANTAVWLTPRGNGRLQNQASIMVAWSGDECGGIADSNCWRSTEIVLNGIRMPSLDLLKKLRELPGSGPEEEEAKPR